MFLANKLNKGAGAPPATPDPQFNYVTMLLHGDGTNGAQNNTFLDSSGNNYTITRNGNTTQGSFSPYGSNWSNNFGSANFFYSASNTAFEFGGGDFTVEAWVFPTSYGTLSYVLGVAATNGLVFYVNSGNLIVRSYNGSDLLSSSTIPALNTWTHVAASRSGTTLRIFVNGVQTATTTNSTSFNVGAIYAGNDSTNAAPWFGYISNLRVVKGSAVYTSNFTPSTTPLTAISGTSWLVSQSNRFVDNSTNNFAIITSGSPSVQRFNPFGTATAYSTSVIGGSGYFDKTGDYLTMPANTATTLGTGDFTVECWVYGLGTSDYRRAFWFQYNSTNNNSGLSVERYTDTGGTTLYALNYSAGQITNTNARGGIYAWNHIAVTRSSGTIRFFINGISQGSAADTGNYTIGTAPLIGNAYESGSLRTDAWDGYISDFRLVKGTALYTSGFTPPTAPLTAITNTSILVNMTNGAIFDNAMMNNLETVGNAQISTSVVKYGTGSIAFDGTGDWLITPYTPNLDLGEGNFTVECWVYPNATATQPLFSITGSTSSDFSQLQVAIKNDNTWYLLISTSNNSWVNTGTSGSYSPNNWYHVAAVRNGSTFTLYVNGNSVLTQSTSSALYAYGGATRVGANANASLNFNGYIDDLRITKGYARYTANFTPPTAAFPNIGPV